MALVLETPQFLLLFGIMSSRTTVPSHYHRSPSRPSAKAVTLGSISICIHYKTVFKTIGKFSFPRNHISTHNIHTTGWSCQDSPAKDLGYPTQRAPFPISATNLLWHRKQVTSFSFQPPFGAEVWQCLAQWCLDLQFPAGYKSLCPDFQRSCHWWKQQKVSASETVGLLSLRCLIWGLWQ